MNIPDSLLSSFAKMTNLSLPANKEYEFYATVTNVNENGKDITVLLDGADNITTPCITAVACEVGDRVIVSFKNRQAVATSNLTKNVITAAEIDVDMARIEELIASRATVQELNAATATLNNLIAARATITQLNAVDANLSTLISQKATITQLNTQRAEINTLLARKIEANDLKTNNIEIKGKLIGSTGEFNGKLVVNWAKTGAASGTVKIGDTTVGYPFLMTWSNAVAGLDAGQLFLSNSLSNSSTRLITQLDKDGLVVHGTNDEEAEVGPNHLYIQGSAGSVQASDTGIVVYDAESGKTAYLGIGAVHDGVGYCTHTGNGTARNIRILTEASTGTKYLEIRAGDSTSDTAYGIYITVSDRELKKDIEDSEVNAIDILKRIRHRSFKWKETDSKVDLGYIAQELGEVIPNSTLQLEGSYCQIITDAIVPYLSKAIQEQQETIESLEARIQRLEEIINGET